jgi:hypothetical protein
VANLCPGTTKPRERPAKLPAEPSRHSGKPPKEPSQNRSEPAEFWALAGQMTIQSGVCVDFVQIFRKPSCGFGLFYPVLPPL